MPVPTSLVLADSPQSYSFAAAIVVGTPFTGVCRAIYVGTGGSATVTMQNGDSITFAGLVSGSILPVRATQVSAVTGAANLVALY
jgi:hypothetical protein